MEHAPPTFTAFRGPERVAHGPLETLVPALQELAAAPLPSPLIFADADGRQVDFDLRGSAEEAVARALAGPPEPPPGRGRPKLGVTSREVTLLPRHWAWLEQQPSGASAALRRLVEDAIRRDPIGEAARTAAEATNRVMTALGGDLLGYEEATRALFAGDEASFTARIAAWPEDLRSYLGRLAVPVWARPRS